MEWGKYLAFITCTQGLSSSFIRDHRNFPSISEFISFKCLIPSPPHAFGLQIVFHVTGVQNLFSWPLPRHKKLLAHFFTSLQRSIGILFALMEYRGIVERMCLTRVAHPTWERSLDFQPSSQSSPCSQPCQSLSSVIC